MKHPNTKYSLGSVLNHVCLHQTVIGQESLRQMEMAGEELRWRCPESWVTVDSTVRIKPSRGIIGQERAVTALEFG